MGRDIMERCAQVAPGKGAMFEYLVGEPQNTVTRNALQAGKFAKPTVAGQECPGIALGEGEGEAVG